MISKGTPRFGVGRMGEEGGRAMMDMPRVQAIIETPMFLEALSGIESAEEHRQFCKHGRAHLLDVARIAWILNVEQGACVDREVMYATALLHDIGRAAQYATGEPHDEAGVRVAAAILDSIPEDMRFSEQERADILQAIRGHRGSSKAGESDASNCSSTRTCVLARLIKEADHISRPCYACPVRDDCNWPDERKNLELRI